jgi:hypothetical protein
MTMTVSKYDSQGSRNGGYGAVICCSNNCAISPETGGSLDKQHYLVF